MSPTSLGIDAPLGEPTFIGGEAAENRVVSP
jgi:hypothetical protein